MLEAKRLTCIRGNKALFSDLSFNIQPRELLWLTGANGSGKTSLLRLLTGLTLPYQGEIYWQNQLIQSQALRYIEQLHYVNHSNGLRLGLSIQENLQFAALLQQQTIAAEKIEAILHTLSLFHDRHTQTAALSAGQKRRVALAKLILLPKPLWVLDEPFTALDQTSENWFLTQMQHHIQQGGMVIMSSHQNIPLEEINIKQVMLCSE